MTAAEVTGYRHYFADAISAPVIADSAIVHDCDWRPSMGVDGRGVFAGGRDVRLCPSDDGNASLESWRAKRIAMTPR